MAGGFRSRERLEEAGVSRSELSRRSRVSFAIFHRMAQNSTEQVSLKTFDRLSWSLGEILGRAIEPGEPVARGPEPKRGRRG